MINTASNNTQYCKLCRTLFPKWQNCVYNWLPVDSIRKRPNSLCQSAVLCVRLWLGAQGLHPAAARRHGAFGRQTGKHGGAVAAAPQQSAERQRHAGPCHRRLALFLARAHRCLSGLHDGGEAGGSPAVAIEAPLGGWRAVDGHTDGWRAGSAVWEASKTGGGGGLHLTEARVDGKVGHRCSELAQLGIIKGKRCFSTQYYPLSGSSYWGPCYFLF